MDKDYQSLNFAYSNIDRIKEAKRVLALNETDLKHTI